MFQPISSNHPAERSPLAAYVRTGIDSRVAEADPHALVALLFDGLFESIAQARGAIRNGDLTAKGRAIGRAVGIVDEGLRAALDLRADGTPVRDLHDLYACVAMRLTRRANLGDDAAALEECAALMRPLDEARTAIGPAVRTGS
jgi:flagellar protein FliS